MCGVGKALHRLREVLVEHIVSIDHAQEYAERVEIPEVWSKVAKAQLDGLRIADAIESYIRPEDPSNHLEVIDIATHAGKDEELVKYLRMARKTQREPAVDTALAFSYARLDHLSECNCHPDTYAKNGEFEGIWIDYTVP